MIKKSIIALTLIILGSIGTVVMHPASVSAACPSGKFLTFVPWYDGLTDADCGIVSPSTFSGGMEAFVWTIAINVVNDIFQVVGYVATGFIMYGGFLFMTSAGNPDQASRGRKTLINAIIGLVIAMSAGIIVNFAKGALKI